MNKFDFAQILDVFNFTNEEKEEFYHMVQILYIVRLTEAKIIDMQDVEKLEKLTKKNTINLHILSGIFNADKQKVMNKAFIMLVEELEDLIISIATLDQKKRLLALLN